MTSYYEDGDVTDWIHVGREPERTGFYQVLYDGDSPDMPIDMYSFHYWDSHNWRVCMEGIIGPKSVFGNHQRLTVQEFWRGLKYGNH
jgi:hypothetical protein